jgi:hypothetical protein
MMEYFQRGADLVLCSGSNGSIKSRLMPIFPQKVGSLLTVWIARHTLPSRSLVSEAFCCMLGKRSIRTFLSFRLHPSTS